MNNIEKSKQALAAWRHTRPRKNRRRCHNLFTRRAKMRPWWLKAAAYNILSTTDSNMPDAEGYEVEYCSWSPGRLNLDMRQVETLAVWDRKFCRGRNCHGTRL